MRSLILALMVALSAVTAAAQDWRGQLKMIDQDLRKQNYAHARKWSIKMINSMCEHLGTGPDSMYTLATTVAYRAMAEAGLQKSDEAHWYWHVALALYPRLAQNDWTPYGEVGKWMASQKASDDLQIADAPDPAPVPIKKRDPKCPLSAIAGGYFQPVTVAAIIDDDGTPRCPRLISSTDAPTLIYAALESLRQWQFQPAVVGGKPVAASYQVTVDFKPPRS